MDPEDYYPDTSYADSGGFARKLRIGFCVVVVLGVVWRYAIEPTVETLVIQYMVRTNSETAELLDQIEAAHIKAQFLVHSAETNRAGCRIDLPPTRDGDCVLRCWDALAKYHTHRATWKRCQLDRYELAPGIVAREHPDAEPADVPDDVATP